MTPEGARWAEELRRPDSGQGTRACIFYGHFKPRVEVKTGLVLPAGFELLTRSQPDEWVAATELIQKHWSRGGRVNLQHQAFVMTSIRTSSSTEGPGGASVTPMAASTFPTAGSTRSSRKRSQSSFDSHTLKWRSPPSPRFATT